MVDYFTTSILMCILKFHGVIKQIKIGQTRNIDTFWYADFFSIVNIIGKIGYSPLTVYLISRTILKVKRKINESSVEDVISP